MPKYEKINANRSDLWVTGSVNKDDKRLREYYSANAQIFVDAYDATYKLLKLKTKQKLFIRNIRSYAGVYWNHRKEVAIDIRSRNIQSIVSTIIHECQHALQYEKGDLKLSPKANHKSWKGKCIKDSSALKQYKKYLALPWEVEARNAEYKHIKTIMKTIGQEFCQKTLDNNKKRESKMEVKS